MTSTIARRKIRTWVSRGVTFLGRTRWIVLSTVLAFLGVIGVFVSIPITVTAAISVVGLLALANEIRQHATAQAATVFVVYRELFGWSRARWSISCHRRSAASARIHH